MKEYHDTRAGSVKVAVVTTQISNLTNLKDTIQT